MHVFFPACIFCADITLMMIIFPGALKIALKTREIPSIIACNVILTEYRNSMHFAMSQMKIVFAILFGFWRGGGEGVSEAVTMMVAATTSEHQQCLQLECAYN